MLAAVWQTICWHISESSVDSEVLEMFLLIYCCVSMAQPQHNLMIMMIWLVTFWEAIRAYIYQV